MKLLYCPVCEDLVKIPGPLKDGSEPDFRYCECKESWGRYKDREHALYGGQAIPFGIDNNSFIMAYHGFDWLITAWFYPKPKRYSFIISSEHIHFERNSSFGYKPESKENDTKYSDRDE